jgi:hypothetical protein
MRPLVVILLLLLSSYAQAQPSNTQRKTISHDLRTQINELEAKYKWYYHMTSVWARERDLGLGCYSPMDTLNVMRRLVQGKLRLIDSLAVVEGKNPQVDVWLWPSPFEPDSSSTISPSVPDSARLSRERPPIIGT